MPGSLSNNTEDWSAEAKFSVVVETRFMNETEKSTYCREKGLHPEQLECWRQACIEGARANAGDNERLRHARNEIKRLKRKVVERTRRWLKVPPCCVAIDRTPPSKCAGR